MKRVIAIAMFLGVLSVGAEDVNVTFTSESSWGQAAKMITDNFHYCVDELEELLPPGYSLVINKEHVKVYYASTNEPYRAWTIYYSHGLRYDDTEGQQGWISLYHEPKISHVDMRNFGDWTQAVLTITACHIEAIKEAGSLTNVIKELAASGDICAVLGHSWEHDRPATVGVIRKIDTSAWSEGALLYVGRAPGRLRTMTGIPLDRTCRICKKQDSRTTGEWEEK